MRTAMHMAAFGGRPNPEENALCDLIFLARPVAATKLEDWAAARFQPSAFSTQHLFCFQWLLRNFFAKCKEVTEKESILTTQTEYFLATRSHRSQSSPPKTGSRLS